MSKDRPSRWPSGTKGVAFENTLTETGAFRTRLIVGKEMFASRHLTLLMRIALRLAQKGIQRWIEKGDGSEFAPRLLLLTMPGTLLESYKLTGPAIMALSYLRTSPPYGLVGFTAGRTSGRTVERVRFSEYRQYPAAESLPVEAVKGELIQGAVRYLECGTRLIVFPSGCGPLDHAPLLFFIYNGGYVLLSYGTYSDSFARIQPKANPMVYPHG